MSDPTFNPINPAVDGFVLYQPVTLEEGQALYPEQYSPDVQASVEERLSSIIFQLNRAAGLLRAFKFAQMAPLIGGLNDDINGFRVNRGADEPDTETAQFGDIWLQPDAENPGARIPRVFNGIGFVEGVYAVDAILMPIKARLQALESEQAETFSGLIDELREEIVDGADSDRDTLKKLSDAIDALTLDLDNLALTGIPTAPTAAPGTDTAQIATTAFAKAEAAAAAAAAVTSLVDGAPGALNTLNELSNALGDDANFAGTIAAAMTRTDRAAAGVATYAAARLLTGLSDGDIVQVKGRAAPSDGGQGRFLCIGADTASTDDGGVVLVTADGKRLHRVHGGRVRLRAWAVLNNSADDTAAINTAVAWALANDAKLDWEGDKGRRARITAGLDYNTPGVYRWHAPRINAADVAVGGSVSPKVRIRGAALGSAINLNANASAGDTTLNLTGAPVIGAAYIIQSTQAANGDGVTKRAEAIRIKALVSGSVYELEEPLQASYATASSARIQRFPEDVRAEITGKFDIIGDPAKTSVNDYGFALVRTYGSFVERYSCRDIASSQYLSDLNIDAHLCDRATFVDARNTGQGYGLEVAGGWRLTHGDLRGSNLRHVRTFTHSTGSSGHGALADNMIGRGMHGGNIIGTQMRSSADDSHAGFDDTITGNVITTLAAGITVPEAFVVEHSRAIYGDIIIRGAATSNVVIQSSGHCCAGPDFVRIRSIKSIGSAGSDYAAYVINKSGQNGFSAQQLDVDIDSLGLDGSGKGLRLSSLYGPLNFACKMTAISVSGGEAVDVLCGTNHRIRASLGHCRLDDKSGNTAPLIRVDGSPVDGRGALVHIPSGRLAKTGAGVMYDINDGAVDTGALVDEVFGASATRLNLTSRGAVTKAPEVLTGTRTYYVRPGGSDRNSGLFDQDTHAFQTIARALEVAAGLDTAGNTVIIQLQAGTWTTPVVLPPVRGGGRINILGNNSDPTLTTISVTSADAVRNDLNDPKVGSYRISGVTLQTTTSGDCIKLFGPHAALSYQYVRFAACAGSHVRALNGAYCYATNEYSISGGASAHLDCGEGGQIDVRGRAVTLSGTPAFSGAFARANTGARVYAGGATYSGSATGTRYSVADYALISTGGGGANHFPGNSAGTDNSGSGRYS